MKIFPRQIPTLKFLCAAVVAFAGLTNAVRGQSALDGFDPNANGIVRVAVVQPDGKVLIGGDFTTLAPNGGAAVPRNFIARLNANGTLDTAFNPNANNIVYAIAVQPDGKILVGGLFNGANSIGGQPRNRIARLEPVNGTADSFNPNANNLVSAITVQPDGKILVGGTFTSIGGQPRNRIARLDGSTGTADSFNPNANASIVAIVVQPDGKILVGGGFNTIGGQARTGLARLDATTGLADSFNANANSAPVWTIALQADGKILAGGNFTSMGGQARSHIARLDATTGAPDSFNPNANDGINNSTVHAIAVQPDGKILACGMFTSIGGQARNHIARLDPTTGLADSFNPSASGPAAELFAITVQADGKVLTGGSFSTLSPPGGSVTRNNIARLETDGRLDQTLDIGPGGSTVFATALQPDGKILIGGSFSTVLGVSRNNIARLNTDGTLDTAFNPNANSIVDAIVVQADGNILTGGNFTSIGGQPRNFIARLDATFGGADSWNPNANNAVYAIAVLPDGKILAGGLFVTIGGEARNHIARLDASGFPDSFDPNANSQVLTIAVQADGQILAGGTFAGASSIGGQTRNYIARLDATTGSADSFDPNANSTVNSVAVQADSKILVSGSFSGANSIGGAPRNRIARVDGVTGAADSFNPNASTAGSTVNAIGLQPDGKILAGGTFNTVGGQVRSGFARLSNDIIARQDLAVAQTAVIWTRGGSSPQFERVAFEYSTDNVSYTPLGDGTAAGSTWTLTGLSLPAGQNIYIRARGYYRTGNYNGSESIAESVRNAFVSLPPTPSAVVSRKLHNGAPFDINLPLTGNAGIECRSGGVTNDYQVLLTFPSAVTFTSASVTAGTGTVSSSSGSGTTTVTVNLTGVTNAQRITVTLFGVNNAGDVSVPMGVLVGDTNGDTFVNSGDALQTRSRSGQTTDATNFRSDVNTDGFVNSGDTLAVRNRSGTFLP